MMRCYIACFDADSCDAPTTYVVPLSFARCTSEVASVTLHHTLVSWLFQPGIGTVRVYLHGEHAVPNKFPRLSILIRSKIACRCDDPFPFFIAIPTLPSQRELSQRQRISFSHTFQFQLVTSDPNAFLPPVLLAMSLHLRLAMYMRIHIQ